MENEIFCSKNISFQNKILNAPKTPGVYMYKDISDEIIYVGKAKVLINRVKSYFNNFYKLDAKTQKMISLAENIEFLEVDSEFEALILETNLIKKYRPKYNILMKDDKNYTWVKMSIKRDSKQPLPTYDSIYQDFPKINIVRNKKDDGAEYYGPFPDSRPVKRVLRRLRKLFPYTTAKHQSYEESAEPLIIKNHNKKPDMYYHIGLSLGADAGFESKAEYNKRFDNIRKFFRGEKSSIIKELETEMRMCANKLDFENAVKLRNRINDLKYAATNINISNFTDDILVDEIKEEQRQNAINELIEQLHFPNENLNNHSNFRIECYDISNTQGTNATGSMVVMINGQIAPELYRRFKIRSKNTPNDFLMMQEILTRRFKHLIESDQNINVPESIKNKLIKLKTDESFTQKPDLIIIDGGNGQLSSAYKILSSFKLQNTIPIVGLAKREEELFRMTYQFSNDIFQVNDLDQFSRIWLKRKSESLFLIKRICFN